MFPKDFTKKPQRSLLPTVAEEPEVKTSASHKTVRTIFVIVNLITAALGCVAVLVVKVIESELYHVRQVISDDYKLYFTIAIWLAVFTVIVRVHGVICAGESSLKPIVVNLFLSSAMFVVVLLFLVNYMDFAEAFARESLPAWRDMGGSTKDGMEKFLACSGDKCASILLAKILELMRQVTNVTITFLISHVISYIVGTYFCSKLRDDQVERDVELEQCKVIYHPIRMTTA